MSAPSPGALPSIFSLDPGTDRHDRRGRLRERSDMLVSVPIRCRAMSHSAPVLTLHPLADGVYVWLQPGGESGVSNAGVIVDDDGITVVDTLMVRSQWEPFAAAVQELGLPVRRTILTHSHIDHVGGTKAFPNAGVYASPQTSAVLDQAMPIDAYKRVHARVRRRVRRPRRARHASRRPTRSTARPAHEPHRGDDRERVTPTAT